MRRKKTNRTRPRTDQKLQYANLEERRLLATVPTGFTETVIAANLTSPTTLDVEDNGRIWVAYQDGRIEVIEAGQSTSTLVIQLDTDGSAEHGLQGLELDPNFATNGYIYAYHTASLPAAHNQLIRLTVDPLTGNSIVSGSELVLFDLPDMSTYGNPPWHIGGAVHVNTDGTIMVQIGESQQSALAPDLDSFFGKIFRVNNDGTIPTDNPYYNSGDGITWTDYIWASGLRNPFAGDIDPVTGRYFVADVGGGAYEEINDATLPGLDFGWPSEEGATGAAGKTDPVHAYGHGDGCAITGGAFNHGGTTSFPTQYDGMFFFSEFCSGEIRYIDPDNGGTSTDFATGADYPMNIEFGADGSLYYIDRGAGAGGATGVGTGSIRKIAFVSNIPPQIVLPPSDTLVSVGYDASFTVSAAGTNPLTYQWQVSTGGSYSNIAGADAATLTLNAAPITSDGNQYRVIVTNAQGTETSVAATLSVTADTPPTPFFTLPVMGTTYRAGDTITFEGGANDSEDGLLASSSLSWSVDFHHNVHSHPFIAPTSGITGGQFTIPTETETADDVFFRITLKATDSAGLTTLTYHDVMPLKSEFSVESNLPGGVGDATIDNHSSSLPFADTGVENVQRTLSVPSVQQNGGETAYFSQWIDGTQETDRTILTPQDDTAYVALYQTFGTGGGNNVYLSDLTPTGTPTNGWGPVEFDTSNGEDGAGDGGTITLNGTTYAKGIGAHAGSEIIYNLGGAYTRFISDIGVDDEVGGGSVEFQVWADGAEIFNSGTMTGASATQPIDVSVTGVNELKLIVTNAGDGDGNDHADWANAHVTNLDTTYTPITSINFQDDDNGNTAIPSGYIPDYGDTYADRGNGFSYGWSSDHTDLGRDREVNSEQRVDTLVHFHQNQEWEFAVADGLYQVTIAIGDSGYGSTHTLNVEGTSYWNQQTLNANEFSVVTQVVGVTDGKLTLDSGGAGEKDTRLLYIEIAEADTVEATLLPYLQSDLNLDSHLDQNDLDAFAIGLGQDTSGLTPKQQVNAGDLNFDGIVDNDDWEIFKDAWFAEFGVDPVLPTTTPPTDIALSNNSISENTPTTTAALIGTLSATDADSSSFTYSLVAGAGDSDNATFVITGDQLQIQAGTSIDFETQPQYSIRVSVSDGDGTFEKVMTVDVANRLEIDSIVVGDGTDARSIVDKTTVSFDEVVTLGTGAFTVTDKTTGTVIPVTAGNDTSTGVSVVTLTFSGAFTESVTGSLVDGNYILTVNGSQISSTATGQNLDGDQNGTAGGNRIYGDTETDKFFRFFGDINGDRDVSLADFLQFRGTYGQETLATPLGVQFDADGNGDVSLSDFLALRTNYGSELTF